MSYTDKILNTHELKDIEARVQRVSALLRRSASLWLDIAKEVHDAKQSLSADAYAIFLKKASLTPAIADKMPTIAKTADLYTDEMKKHVHRFDGWSPIYESAKLKSKERDEFFKALNKDPEVEVSRKFIQSFRQTKQSNSPTSMLLAQIKFNENDIQRFDYEQFLELKQKLDDISRIIDRLSPAVSMNLNDKNISDIETSILNVSSATIDEHDEHCDEQLLVTLPAANNDCGFSYVAI